MYYSGAYPYLLLNIGIRVRQISFDQPPDFPAILKIITCKIPVVLLSCKTPEIGAFSKFCSLITVGTRDDFPVTSKTKSEFIASNTDFSRELDQILKLILLSKSDKTKSITCFAYLPRDIYRAIFNVTELLKNIPTKYQARRKVLKERKLKWAFFIYLAYSILPDQVLYMFFSKRADQKK